MARNRKIDWGTVTAFAGGAGAGVVTSKVTGSLVGSSLNPLVQAGGKIAAGAVVIGLSGKSSFGKGIGTGWVANGTDQAVASFFQMGDEAGGNGGNPNVSGYQTVSNDAVGATADAGRTTAATG